MDIRLNGKCSVYGGERGDDSVQFSVKRLCSAEITVPAATLRQEVVVCCLLA